jgi:hypothetical protein
MHWPVAFEPGKAPFPTDDNGSMLADKHVTIAEVHHTKTHINGVNNRHGQQWKSYWIQEK